ncbi:MAG: hypothetical protein JST32_17115 [Bacteroidetes bacterium]|nr:hypothetical protein [Bacteroidota bacterium]
METNLAEMTRTRVILLAVLPFLLKFWSKLVAMLTAELSTPGCDEAATVSVVVYGNDDLMMV